MKKLALILITLVGCMASAQNLDKQARVREILEEKMRLPYEQLVEMYYAQKASSNQGGEAATNSVSESQNKQSVTEIRLSSLASTGIDEGESFIAINPNDSNHLIVSYMEFNQSGVGTVLKFPIYYTLNGGLSWTKSAFLTEDVFANDFPTEIIGGGGDPVFAFDNNGKIYFSWLYLGIDAPNDRASFVMNWASSTDGGATFSVEPDSAHFIGSGELVNLNQGGVVSNNGDGIFDRQWMDVDKSGGPNDGRLYVSTLFIPNDSTKLSGLGTIVRIKEANNALFDTANFSIATTVNTQFGNVAVDGNGTAHVAYTDILNNEVKYSRLVGSSTVFTAPTTISTGRLFPRPGPYHTRSNGALNLVADPVDDNLYACYGDFGIRGGVRSYFLNSTDGGSTWSTPRDISNFTDSNIVLMPTVAAYNGNVSLSYFDIDSVSRTDRKGVHKTIQSVDKGATWLSPRTLSSDTTQFGAVSARWFGDYNNAVRTPCRTYSVWSDGRSGNSTKIYLAITDNCQELDLMEISPIIANLSVSNVFPNPVKSNFSITVSTLNKTPFSAQIIDIKGTTVHKYKDILSAKGINTFNFDVPSALAKGIYLLELRTSNEHFVRKLVVE